MKHIFYFPPILSFEIHLKYLWTRASKTTTIIVEYVMVVLYHNNNIKNYVQLL